MNLRLSKEISPKTFLHIEDRVKNKLSWQDNEYKQLVVDLFSQTPWQNENKQELSLTITLSLLRGGRSSATVLKLAFVDDTNKYSLIIRSHSSEQDAQEEQNNVKKLRINSADCFANFIEELNISDQYLLVYEDASINMGGEVQELRESLLNFLSIGHKTTNDFIAFASNFQDLINRVTTIYKRIEKGIKGIDSYQHCNNILSELPPDLVINKSCLYQSENLIFKYQSVIPNEAEQAEPITKEQVLGRLSEKNLPVQWFKLSEIWLEDKDYFLTGKGKMAYLAFFFEINTTVVRIWIGIDKDEIRNIELKLDIDKSYQLIFLAEDITFTAQLKKMGFDTQSCLATLDFQALCEKHYSQLYLDMRHNDLHCGNILTSGNSFKVIDVGDMKADLIASDIARLEVSLWFEISKRLSEFSEQEAKTVIENLMTDDVYTKNLRGFQNLGGLAPNIFLISTRFSDFLRHLRKGFEVGVQPDKTEIVLAYVIQILLYQRYSLLDGIKIPPAFNVFARHWISQFRYNVDFAELPAEVGEVVHHLESLVDRKLVTWDIVRKAYNDSIPKLHDSPNFLQDERQNCFRAIYSIASLLQRENNSPLVKFSCYIAEALADANERKSLNNLIAKHFTYSCPSQDSEPKQVSNCDLWVIVSTDRMHPNYYSVKTHLNKKMLLETEFIEANEFCTVLPDILKQAYSELMSHLEIKGLCTEQVWIRFVLPRTLLSEAVDQYELDEETWGTLGTEFKITISLWERAKYPKYSVSVRKCWIKYKEKMVNEVRCSDDINSLQEGESYIPAFIVNNSDSPKQVFIKTKDAKVMVALLPFPPETLSLNNKTDYLNALIQAGVPVILWTRNAESNFIPTDNHLENCIFCQQKLTELPKCVYEERKMAYGSEDSSHIGNHLTLLWDDPTFHTDERLTVIEKREDNV